MAAGLLVAGGPLAVPSQAKLNEGLLQDGPRAPSGLPARNEADTSWGQRPKKSPGAGGRHLWASVIFCDAVDKSKIGRIWGALRGKSLAAVLHWRK